MYDKSRTTWSSSSSLSQISINSNSNDNSQLQLQQSQHPQHSQQQPHSEFILNGLQTLKTKNILCDVTLIAQSLYLILIPFLTKS